LIFESILNRAPIAVSRFNPNLSPRIEEVINKCLEKDRNLRYQHASDIRTDLQRLRRDTESGRVKAETKAVETKPSRNVIWWLAGGAVPAVLGLVIWGSALRSRKVSALTEKDTVVVGEFANTTGDPVFDDTLRQGLSSQLEQSPFLNLLSDDWITHTLQLMEQAKNARLTYPVALEVCKRTASMAMIGGSIAKLGNQYVLGIKAVTCGNGESLANVQVTAEGKEQVLNALGAGGVKLREKLGESVGSIQKFDVPLEEVTTSSLEALNAYTLGRRARREKGYVEAIPLYRQAVEMDPNFAAAQLALGIEYSNIGESNQGMRYLEKAYELRDRVSTRERFDVTSTYFGLGMGDLPRAQEIYKLWKQTYPQDAVPRDGLGNAYIYLGQFAQAVEELEEERSLARGGYYNYYNLVVTYSYLGRWKEAKETAEWALTNRMELFSATRSALCDQFS
jgi:hypothetical protein